MWLPNHVIEATTRQGYTYQLHAHLIPVFGPILIPEIRRLDIRLWVAASTKAGIAPATLRGLKNLLSAVLQAAVLDELIDLNPCRGLRTPFAGPPPLQVLTPQQFDTLAAAFTNPVARLMAETAVSTGLRWGELTELRVCDFNPATRMLAIDRTVVVVARQFHPDGQRFLIKNHTKNRTRHRVKISADLAGKLTEHILAHRLRRKDLLFHADMLIITRPRRRKEPGPRLADIRRHGTTSAYSSGCRCDDCRDAMSAYRRRRRQLRHDRPTKPTSSDGHIEVTIFRINHWLPALRRAGLPFPVRFHDLRHAHATWLLVGGATVADVKKRLNQASIQAAERYLHNLPDADDQIVEAFERVRTRISPTGDQAWQRS
ncbi:tyrosine-type recombinase/integrase [Catelliglobosispora koreensis]|uniref:tyrosine-type recombinase/integrase n=1 Tax=Catelliglobosispora koreensis TaxID=129052 RepID=UPI000362E36A|nr:site-specific integrase [Catelliglobosispora koreensis]